MPRRMVRPATLVVRDAAPARPVYDTEDIVRINAIIANSRPTWFALLGALVFCGITLLGVKDLDFFAANQKTQLPLVNVSVPVTYFFLAGSALVAAAYIYLHLYLELLWAALGSAAARYGLPPGDDPLSEHIQPWQVAEWGLRHRDWLRGRIAGAPLPDGQRSAPRRDLSVISSMMSIIFVWLFGPAVLFYFWWRSMPAHDGVLTTVTGLLFAFSCWIGWRSARRADQLLAGADLPRRRFTLPLLRVADWRRIIQSPPASLPADGRPTVAVTASPLWRVAALRILVALVLVVPLSFLRTGSPLCPLDWQNWLEWRGADSLASLCKGVTDDGWPLVAKADLAEARIVEQPKDWKSRKEAERDFRAEWGKRESVPHADPFAAIAERNFEREFQDALASKRKPVGDALVAPLDEEGYRVKWAGLQGIEPRAPFASQAARDVERDFKASWSERRGVYLDTLAKPQLDGRNLRSADLSQAFLPGVQMRGARLEGAILLSARLEGANFSSARFEGAILSDARLDGAILTSARLDSADLRGARLDGADLRFARLDGANLTGAGLEGASLAGARLDGADLTFARLEGATLMAARLDRADLTGVSFETADLTAASLSGARIFGGFAGPLDLNVTSLAGSYWSRSAVREANLERVDMGVLSDFDSSFGDGSVKLPKHYVRPCQWAGEVLSDEQFFGRWRGWLEAHGDSVSHSLDLQRYPAIPPPSGCTPRLPATVDRR